MLGDGVWRIAGAANRCKVLVARTMDRDALYREWRNPENVPNCPAPRAVNRLLSVDDRKAHVDTRGSGTQCQL